jgi:hypothetical protein
VSPNNLATLEALPENQVYMATALSGLTRSIANTLGPAVAAVVWDQRYTRHLQHFAEETPLDAYGLTTALDGLEQTLQWSGELLAQIPTQVMALLRDRLFAEASTSAWQDYFLFNALLAVISLLPALPCWRRRKYQASTTPQVVATPASHTTASNGHRASPAMHPDNPSRTSQP